MPLINPAGFILNPKNMLCLVSVILALSREITQELPDFSIIISRNRENHHSQSSQFTQIVKREITFMLDSRKF